MQSVIQQLNLLEINKMKFAPTVLKIYNPTAAVEGNSQNLTVSGTAGASTAMPAGINTVRLCFGGSTISGTTGAAPCYVSIGAAPVVTASAGMRLVSGQTEYLAISPGEKVSVIGTDGELNITPMTT